MSVSTIEETDIPRHPQQHVQLQIHICNRGRADFQGQCNLSAKIPDTTVGWNKFNLSCLQDE